MKRVLWILGGLLLLSLVSSFADSVTDFSNLNVTFQIVSSVRATFQGEIFGPGISAYATGHMPAPWFSTAPNVHYLPGSVVSGTTEVFFESVSGTAGSDTGSDYTFSFIDAGSYAFPTNGKNFTVNLPATLESFYLNGFCNVSCYPALLLNFKPGDLRLSYTYSDGQYYPASGSFSTVSSVPEPATLGLVALGAAAVAWRKRKQI